MTDKNLDTNISHVDASGKNETQWKKELNPEQYRVLREKATEAPFSGEYYHHDEKGIYHCAGCGASLFPSGFKYNSGSGWPSFFNALSPEAIKIKRDVSLGMVRDEILCARCGGHLGHIFPDGPKPTGLRYCVNSLSLSFEKSKLKEDKDL